MTRKEMTLEELDVIARTVQNPFKPGDKVVCIILEFTGSNALQRHKVYTVVEPPENANLYDKSLHIWIGNGPTDGGYFHSRFTFAYKQKFKTKLKRLLKK